MSEVKTNDSEDFLRSTAEDAVTVRRILDGDNNAFQALEKKYRRLITSLIRKMIRNDSDVADLVQESFIKAYVGLSSYQPEFPFSAWLYRIASNTCIDFLRKRRVQTISIDAPITADDGDMHIEIPDTSYLADTHIYADERKQLLRQALESLPEKYLRVMKMRHEEELEYQDIADRLEVPIGTVKALIFRARKRMYEALKQYSAHFEE
ncbi:RNA polymerase sigma factor RpoE [Ignavibacteria bacterium]|nr:sigma-70 family RNA polymerase sigma factor [Bacteroidota bacterium]MCZ2133338.1 sigma-70 family RNA polymerase sigma factor [Bacteroidota bacterium]